MKLLFNNNVICVTDLNNEVLMSYEIQDKELINNKAIEVKEIADMHFKEVNGKIFAVYTDKEYI